ncbi:tryptophan transporter [Niallia endozanthoxylica]|uniref:Tryptophan transporter n=1 Tax=Niallia endozanthoxylica TaxID=2036016 RepID=A0A5J5I772_9BACI|nr:tryptophan transporter [Niallia endozanthoxylica]KAA9031652.1 tryptophan transporter [Niallia endozanthoxylica]
MNTKNLVALALLVGMGTVLHAVVPGFFLGMKPDMMLTMMFLGIVLFPDRKSVLLLGLATGIISGITTTFPGGLFPNIIDKFVTSFVFFALFLALNKYSRSIISVAVLTAVGTVISGIVFLGSAYLIVGLPGPFAALFATVVLPAAAVNTIVMIVLYPVATSILKRTKITNQQTISQ